MISTSSPSTDPSQLLLNTTLDSCALKYDEFVIPNTVPYCNWTWDNILCWPPTPAGTTIRQRCPPAHGIDTTKFAERRCSAEGRWEGKPGGTLNSLGWTNYTPCYSPEVVQLFRKLYAGGSNDEADIKIVIAERTRTLEIVGFSLSLTALIISLVIFCRFRFNQFSVLNNLILIIGMLTSVYNFNHSPFTRIKAHISLLTNHISLRNNRTRIHKNLFVAMVIQVIIRLTLYIDQAIIRRGSKGYGNENSRHGIDNTPYLCEASYILLEYARTCMFMWMFIEGLYLHNVVTVTVFQGRFPHTLYAMLGWGGPVALTAIWAVTTAQYVGQQKCWWGYNLTPYYWILEGPRLAVVLLNFIFLLNIIRVLIVKLRQSHTSDVEQVRKAVRAAVVLVPLLGITNLLNMTEAPLDRTALEFALWSYVTHFLTSFQGLFIALLYCFLNGEVRIALMKSLSVYLSIRGHHDWPGRRQSMFSAAYGTAPETEAPNVVESNRKTSRTESKNWITLCFKVQKNPSQAAPEPAPPESVIFDISD